MKRLTLFTLSLMAFLSLSVVSTVVVWSQPTQFSGPASSFPIKFTSTTPPDASGNERFISTTETFSGTIELLFTGGGLQADEGGCFVKFSGDDGTTFCVTDASLIRTFDARERTDQLLLLGTGDFSKPTTGGNKTGPFFMDAKGSLRKIGTATITITITLNGSIEGWASDGEFIFSGKFRTTLNPSVPPPVPPPGNDPCLGCWDY